MDLLDERRESEAEERMRKALDGPTYCVCCKREHIDPRSQLGCFYDMCHNCAVLRSMEVACMHWTKSGQVYGKDNQLGGGE